MKALFKIFLALAFFTVPAIVSSAEIILDSEYGTELNIFTDYNFPTNDKFSNEIFSTMKLYPTWSNNGESIVFMSCNRLWMVSSDGGNAKMLFGKEYKINGNSYVVGAPTPIGFTSDGKEIIFYDWVFDEDRGADVSVTSATGYSFSKPAYDIFALNIETGELRLIVSNGWLGTMSKDGKYLCYLNYDWKINYDDLQTDHHRVPKILNLETGEIWFLNDDESFGAKIQGTHQLLVLIIPM